MKQIIPKYYTKMYTVAKLLGISYPTIVKNYRNSDWLITIDRVNKTTKYMVDIQAFKQAFNIDLTEYL